MFRNPRSSTQTPSVGRPPSPPTTPDLGSYRKKPTYPGNDNADYTSMAAAKTVTSSRTSTRASARTPAKAKMQQTTLLPNNWAKAPSSGSKKDNGKSSNNHSITTFFKKSEDGVPNGLFIEERGTRAFKTPSQDEIEEEANNVDNAACTEDARYNEAGGSVKRRRTGDSVPVVKRDESGPDAAALVNACTPPPQEEEGSEVRAMEITAVQDDAKMIKPRRSGPFAEDSDSEDERPVAAIESVPVQTPSNPSESHPILVKTEKIDTDAAKIEVSPIPRRPALEREETSYSVAATGFDDFDAMDDFEDDEFPAEGEEYQVRRFEEEQRRLEMAAMGIEEELDEDEPPNDATTLIVKHEEVETGDQGVCPMCSLSLAGASETDAAVHVNSCLDGKPTPLPDRTASPKPATANGPDAKRFRRPERAPRPGQENPFVLGQAEPGGKSAFSKLMAGHSEESAWATAAATENASRGKPSWQRTCPFYKILPGFFIAVDAFRYGAVKDANAYFLSHFHSDHYIGLTASWNHGPIYCSKVTANLVKQQLRVDPKFVIALDWEKEVEVPGTDGVRVTMISANHCPGSSLYLFEKTTSSKGKSPKKQRVLHCGDFRACRAHVEHPLLRPDVMDIVGGKTQQQKLDVCYLDTTYLNPKYAFPSQEDVIKACADMCVSLSKENVDENDSWEQAKRERAGEGMAKFVRKDSSSSTIKVEPGDDDPNTIMGNTATAKKRGRLLVVVGTYSIGKERICLGIARALNSKIYAPPGKQRICAALEDPELNSRLTTNPIEAQVHMTPLFEIRADTLDDYLKDYGKHFSRAVGFRPSGWNYRPPNSRFTESPSVSTVLNSANWKSTYSMRDLAPQRGSTSRAACFGVPYSEHSSFRELTIFCTALRIEKIIPTVNVGSAKSRERMKAWCDRWATHRRKEGLFNVENGQW